MKKTRFQVSVDRLKEAHRDVRSEQLERTMNDLKECGDTAIAAAKHLNAVLLVASEYRQNELDERHPSVRQATSVNPPTIIDPDFVRDLVRRLRVLDTAVEDMLQYIEFKNYYQNL